MLLDTRLYPSPASVIDKILEDFPAEIIGISSMTNESKSAHRLAAAAKKAVPAAKIVIGGPYPTTAPELALMDANIDCAVIGEGEETFVELVGVLERSGGDLEKVKGLAFMKNGALLRTPSRELIEDLDSLPFPDWDAVDIKAYPGHKRMSFLNNDNWMPLFTSRGCPFSCVFCHKIFGRRFRARSAEKVLEEIGLLQNKYGIREFDIVDDIFNFSRERAERICEMIAANRPGIRLSFSNGLRLDLIDEKFIKKLAEAGTKALAFPVDTLGETADRFLGKRTPPEALNRLIDRAVGLGILSTGFFMLGFPGETRAGMLRTVDFAVGSRLHAAEFFAVTPFRGTALWEMSGVKPAEDEYAGGEYDYFRKTMSPELRRTQLRAYLRFYGHPGRIIRLLAAYLRVSPLRSVFMRIASAFMRIFF